MKRNVQTENKRKRQAGILMPVSSLPSSQGIGTLGEGAYAFVDWLESAGMKIWQVLPLLPTGYGDSPYQSFASDALNYYFIDFDALAQQGLLDKSDYEDLDWGKDERRVDYGKQFSQKTQVLRKAFAAFDKTDDKWREFLAFGQYYDFALFTSLKIRFGYKAWDEWDEPLKRAQKDAIAAHEKEYREEIEFWQFTQFVFLEQWKKLKAYANGKGISIMGDMPIYVAYDSVETWLYRKELFALDRKGNVSLRAGVPPDDFCEDGQLWGNPVYDWKKMKKDGYSWWKNRIRYAFSLFDSVRIDHFRGFDRFYAIPASAETAKEGEWQDGPKVALFEDMKTCAIVAEDLGVIDEGVRTLMRDTGYPGMKVFEFAFNGDPENEYLPSQYSENCVAYTGTHDNDTLRAFLENMDKKQRREFEEALEAECLKADVAYICETLEDECESIVRLLMSSKANVVIVPMHDVLCFGEEARLNAPSTVSDRNWTFRFTVKDFKKRKAAWLKALTEEYHR
ncbi:MAG: 4-alpha-glucanotransferase [Clostridia bacterium]|nr:4-alpha-glucanotransferase [Clostridia bacterium]